MRKKPKHDTELFYKGHKVGEGTAADGLSYTQLMIECNGDPYEVLDRYRYFSVEVLSALRKACKLYDKYEIQN